MIILSKKAPKRHITPSNDLNHIKNTHQYHYYFISDLLLIDIVCKFFIKKTPSWCILY